LAWEQWAYGVGRRAETRPVNRCTSTTSSSIERTRPMNLQPISAHEIPIYPIATISHAASQALALASDWRPYRLALLTRGVSAGLAGFSLVSCIAAWPQLTPASRPLRATFGAVDRFSAGRVAQSANFSLSQPTFEMFAGVAKGSALTMHIGWLPTTIEEQLPRLSCPSTIWSCSRT